MFSGLVYLVVYVLFFKMIYSTVFDWFFWYLVLETKLVCFFYLEWGREFRVFVNFIFGVRNLSCRLGFFIGLRELSFLSFLIGLLLLVYFEGGNEYFYVFCLIYFFMRLLSYLYIMGFCGIFFFCYKK